MNNNLHQEFELAYQEQFGRMPQNWNEDFGKYIDAHAQGAYWGWKEALKSRQKVMKSLKTLLSVAGSSVDKVLEDD